MEAAKWKHLIGQHLGKKHIKRSVDLMWDVLCVDCGLKPALLLDFAVPGTASVVTLLHALKSAGLLTNPLTVVTIEVDVLIVNPRCFGDDVTEPPLLSDVLFLDVSANLDSPRWLLESSHLLEQTKDSFRGVLGKLDSANCVPIDAQLDHHTNPSTLFGLFLGYPVVYYYDMTLDSQDNCLSMVPLVNFVLKGARTKTKADTPCNNREHVISSFTVTQSHMSMAADRVDAWFEGKKERGLQCQLFDNLHVARRVVQVPSVCL